MGRPALPSKTCSVCGHPFNWRKKWERDWERIKYCSKKCAANASKEPRRTNPDAIAATVRRTRIAEFTKTSEIGAGARVVFAWHQSPAALRRLIPPWERVEVERAPASLADGQTAVLVLRVGPLKLRWVARHRSFIDRGDEGGEFTDEQVSGPFASWVHRHIVRATGPDRCVLEDRIEYTLPGGRLGELLAGWHVRRKLARMFEYRHQATESAVLGERNNHGTR